MNWLGRKGTQQAAICIDADVIHVAQVVRVREGLPVVSLCHSEAIEGNAGAVLQRTVNRLGLQSFQCTAVMPWQGFRLLVVEKPAVPPEELREAVRWRLAGVLDYPPEQAVVDTVPIVIDLAGGTHASSLYAVAASSASIGALTEQFRRSEIRLGAIDVADLAMRNVAALFDEPGAGTALAWFHEQGSGIVFVAAGELCLVRHLEPNIAELRQALASGDELFLDRIELGLQRALDHFERNFTAVPINRLLLAPCAGIHELAAHLSGHLNVPAQVAELDKVLELGSAPQLRDPQRASAMLVILGAALRPQ